MGRFADERPVLDTLKKLIEYSSLEIPDFDLHSEV